MNNPIPHHLIIEHLFPFLFSIEEMEQAVLKAIETRSLNDLLFLLGRSPTSIPSYLTRNEEYAQAASFTVVLPILAGLGFRLSTEIFEAAASKGNLDVMKWLKEKKCPWNAWTFYYASEHDNLVNMKWLRENGCPWNEEAFVAAARHGNLDNMKWLKENGCPWGARTFYYAEDHGDLANVRWLKENGCPHDHSEDGGADSDRSDTT